MCTLEGEAQYVNVRVVYGVGECTLGLQTFLIIY